MAISQTITDLSTPPSRSDPTNFDARADVFLSELDTLATEINTWAGQANALATTIAGNETAAELAETNAETAQTAAELAETNAETAETNAETAQTAAELAETNAAASASTASSAGAAAGAAAAGAAAWSSGTTYDLGDCAFGTDSHTYRSAQGSNTNHNPVGDGGTWWVILTSDSSGKNAIINGDFNVWQRGTSFAAIAHTAYSADRSQHFVVGTSIHTVTQDADVPTQAESGHQSNYSLKIDCTTADASIAAGDMFLSAHIVEGYNISPFRNKLVTLSFWVKAVKTGIYCVGFLNNGNDKSYVAEYTVSSASTWEKKTITLTMHDGDTGTWNFTNMAGLKLFWAIAAGSTYQTTADAWQDGFYFATSNQVNGVDHTDNNFWLSQVQFELGDRATDFEYEQIEDTLAKCQRYYERIVSGSTYTALASATPSSATRMYCYIKYSTVKRSLPSVGYSTLRLFDGAANTPVTGVASHHVGLSSAKLLFDGSGGGLTIGNGGLIESNNSTTAYIDFSSEL